MVIFMHFRYPLYVQAIPGGGGPMIYSAVVGPGAASGGAPQLVQWKATSSAAHHAGCCVFSKAVRFYSRKYFLCL